MGRFVCVLLLATTPCSFGLAALAADLPPRMEAVAPVALVPACQILCVSDTDPESRSRRVKARVEQQSGYCTHRL